MDMAVTNACLAIYTTCLVASLLAVHYHETGNRLLSTSKRTFFLLLVLLFVLRVALFTALRSSRAGCWDYVNVNPFCCESFRLGVTGHVVTMLMFFVVLFNFIINANVVLVQRRLLGKYIAAFAALYVIGVVLVLVVPQALDDKSDEEISRRLNLYLGTFSLVASVLFLGTGLCVVKRLRALARTHAGGRAGRAKLLSSTWQRAGAAIVLAAAM